MHIELYAQAPWPGVRAVYEQGIGRKLLRALVTAPEQTGIWPLQAGVFPENIASFSLREARGFRTVGYRERNGQMRGFWRNTMLPERRSRVVGAEPEPQSVDEHA